MKCINLLFIHTLSDYVGLVYINSLKTCFRINFSFNVSTFCDRQNIEISRNINNVFMHYLCQQSPPFWWLQNLNSLNEKYICKQVLSMSLYSLLPLFVSIKKVIPMSIKLPLDVSSPSLIGHRMNRDMEYLQEKY